MPASVGASMPIRSASSACERASLEPDQAAAFLARYRAGQNPVRGLRAAAFPGTGAASFGDAARQSAQYRGPL